MPSQATPMKLTLATAGNGRLMIALVFSVQLGWKTYLS
jgi:hypothetical protein